LTQQIAPHIIGKIGYEFNASPEMVVEQVVLNLRRNVPYFYDTLCVIKFTLVSALIQCPKQPWWSAALAYINALTKLTSVILTPWVMPLALGLCAIHLGGKWHMPPPLPTSSSFLSITVKLTLCGPLPPSCSRVVHCRYTALSIITVKLP
jgi:hypothetical protein